MEKLVENIYYEFICINAWAFHLDIRYVVQFDIILYHLMNTIYIIILIIYSRQT